MLMQQLADYAIRDKTARLPDEVIHHAKRAVIDWYAALLPGSVVAPATLLEQAFEEDLDRGRARLASGRRETGYRRAGGRRAARGKRPGIH